MWYNDTKDQRQGKVNKSVEVDKKKQDMTQKNDTKNMATTSKMNSPPSPEMTRLDLSKLETSTTINGTRSVEPFFVEDDRKSKITVVSLKSDRTTRTVQTLPSVIEPQKPKQNRAKGALRNVKQKVKTGFRDSSIKRIIGSGLTIATFAMLLFGVFLPFWNVYTYTVEGVATGHYGGLWSYCLHTESEGTTHCHTFTEASNEHWFRAVRFFELMGFLGMTGLLGLVIAYMFFLRKRSHSFIQWIIVGLCFGIGVFVLLGLIIYAACYTNASHISSAYGLTFCAVFGCAITGALFLWDKIEMDKRIDAEQATKTPRASTSVARSVRSRAHSRRSHAQSQRSHPASHRSHPASHLSHAPSTRLAMTDSVLPITHAIMPPTST